MLQAEPTIRLLERARIGDREALDALFERHRPALARWARGRLPAWARDVTDTQDLVQDVLLQVLGKIGTFEARGPGALHAYLRQSVRNRLADELRRAHRRPLHATLDSRQADLRPSPLEAAMGREGIERYERALERLSPDEREAVVARLELGVSYQEIADTTGRPSADAARKTVERAIVRLVEEMKGGA